MNPSNSTRTPTVSPSTKHRLESVRPYAQKFQYRQLPLPEPVRPPEPVAQGPAPVETEKKTEAQS